MARRTKHVPTSATPRKPSGEKLSTDGAPDPVSENKVRKNPSFFQHLRDIRAQRALQLAVLAAISSPLSQLNLSPVYGSVPSGLYHHYGLVASVFLAFGLRGRLPAWIPKVIPSFAFWIPTVQFGLFQFSSALGPRLGPFVTELLTYYPLLFLSIYTAFELFDSVYNPSDLSSLSEPVPAMALFLLFSILRRSAKGWFGRYIGSNVLSTRIMLQMAVSALYSMVLPTSLFWPALPSMAITMLANPHNALQRTTDVLNNTLALHDYTLIARQESLTGYISVLESNKDHFRIMRCDHSLLGGNWMLPPRPASQGPPRLVPEPIYAVFTMLEAVRLMQPQPSKPLASQMALNIGLGVGTAPTALISHGINTTILELDPYVHRYAIDYFNLPHNHTYYIGDAVAVVAADVMRNQTSLYTHIIHDVFTGGAEPAALFTVSFLSGLRKLMTDDGVIAINYAGDLAQPTTSLVYRTIKSVFGSCRVFREEPKPSEGNRETASAKAGVDFTNMVFFCTKPATPITFRKPTEIDFLGSSARSEFLVPKYEVLPEEFDREGNLLTEKNIKEVERYQANSAVGHWRVMRNVIPDVIWENW